MNNKGIKSLVTVVVFTIGFLLPHQASAKVYTFEGETTSIVSSDSLLGVDPIGGSFTVSIDVSNPPDNEGKEFAFLFFPPEFDANSLITFDTGQVFSSSMSRILAAGGNVRYSLLNPMLGDDTFSNGRIELAGQRLPPKINLDFLMGTLDTLIISGDGFRGSGTMSLVSVVPEPSSYVLLVAGLGFVSYVTRRKGAKK